MRPFFTELVSSRSAKPTDGLNARHAREKFHGWLMSRRVLVGGLQHVVGWGVRGEGQILSDSMQSNWCLLVSEHVHCVHSCSLVSEQTFPLFYLCKSLIYIYIILIIIIIVHLFTHF